MTSPTVADVTPYLGDTAIRYGGRGARPRALATLVAAHAAHARTGRGVMWTAIGTVGAIGIGSGLASHFTGVGVVLAAIGLVTLGLSVWQGWVLVRQGRTLIGAAQRWHALAPEQPVAIAPPEPGRRVLAVVAIVLGVAAAAVPVGDLIARLPAAVVLIVAGAVALVGDVTMARLRTSSAPQAHAYSFAPPPGSAPPVNPGDAPPWQAPQAEPFPPVAQAPPTPPAMPAPSTVPQPAQPAPPAPAPPAQPLAPEPPHSATPLHGPADDDDIGHTRLVRLSSDATTTLAGRLGGIVVTMEDGRQLPVDAVTLVGRDPAPRDGEDVDALMSVVHPEVSKTHLWVRVQGATVTVMDRASSNGTVLVGPDLSERPLVAWQETPVVVGSVLRLGSYRVSIGLPGG